MSRTLGTGIDPEDALEPYGADATRYGLRQGHLDAGRALLVRLDRGGSQARDQALERRAADPRERGRGRAGGGADETLEERWILARLDAARAELEECLGRLDLAPATAVLYHLTFDDFCDWYAEAIKPRLYDGDEARVRPRSLRSSVCSRCCIP